MKFLRFLVSPHFFFVCAILALVFWTLNAWDGSGAMHYLRHGATAEEVVNVAIWGCLAVGVIIYAAIKSARSDDNSQETHFRYYGAGIVAAIGIVACLSWLVWRNPEYGPFATLMGAFMATAGWLTSAMLTVHNQRLSAEAGRKSSEKAANAAAVAARKRHTLNILIDIRQNEIFNLHRSNIADHFPLDVDLTQADVDTAKQAIKTKTPYTPGARPKVYESLAYLTNYYEFLCAALREGDLDETLLRKSYRQILVAYVKKVRPFIDTMIKDNGKKTYEQLLAIVKKWEDEDKAAAPAPNTPAGTTP